MAPGRAQDRLRHRLLRAHAFQHRVGADAVGQLLDAGDALFAALRHDVGRAELEGEVLAALVAAHRDDALRAHLLGRENAHQADRAVADDDDRRAGSDTRRIGRIPAGAQHVRSRQQVGNEIGGGNLGGRHQRAVGQRHAGVGRLRPGHELALLAGGLEAELAMRAGVVGDAEGADDELAGRTVLTSLPTSTTMPQYSWPMCIGPSIGCSPR